MIIRYLQITMSESTYNNLIFTVLTFNKDNEVKTYTLINKNKQHSFIREMNILPIDYEGMVPYSVLTISISFSMKRYIVKEYRFCVYDSEKKLVYIEDSEDSEEYEPFECNSNISKSIGEKLRDKFNLWSTDEPNPHYFQGASWYEEAEYKVKVDLGSKDE